MEFPQLQILDLPVVVMTGVHGPDRAEARRDSTVANLGQGFDTPVVVQRQVPTVLIMQKFVEMPLLQFTVKVVDIFVVEVEIMEVIEVGVDLPAESAPPRFVTACRVGARTPVVCLVIRFGRTSTGAGCGENSRDDTRQPIGRVVDILCRGAKADPYDPGRQ